MKKLCLCLLSLLLALSLAACQGSNACTCQECPCSTSSNQPVDATTVVESTPPPADASLKLSATEPTPPPAIELTDPEYADLTTRQIVENTLAGKKYTRNGRIVQVWEDDAGWLSYKIGNKYLRLNSQYLYNLGSWTPESVAQSYLDGTVTWLKSDDADFKASPRTDEWSAMLWSWDFEHEFDIRNDGWLFIDGVRSLPVTCTTYADLDPMLMVERYQSGEWDGSRAWSEDYRTSVEFPTYSHHLLYRYYYGSSTGQSNSAESLAYVYPSSATSPWWETTQHQYHIDPELSRNETYASTWVYDLYPDLPGGSVVGCTTGDLAGEYAISRRYNSLTVETTSGLYQFAKGQLLNYWQLTIDPENGGDYSHYGTDDLDGIYFYTGSQLVQLHSGGRYDVVLAQVAASWADECTSHYYIEGDMLKYISIDSSQNPCVARREIAIPDRIVTAAAGRYRPFVSFENDANVYSLDAVYSDGTYRVTALGPGTVDEYVAMYHDWEGYFSEFVTTCRVKNGLEPS